VPRSDALLIAVSLLALADPAGSTDRRLGERLYREGVNARGEPIRSLVGQPPAPLNGAVAACEACHALWADPTTEAAAPALRWSALVDASRQPLAVAYTEPSFARAVNEGVAPSGQRLSAAMPRYSLSRSETAALVAFLKSLPAPAPKPTSPSKRNPS
jgi:cytochrome c553